MTRWADFLKSGDFLILAHTARMFSQRPSKMLGIEDAAVALEIDTAAATRLLMERGAGDDDEELEDVPLERPKSKARDNRDRTVYY